VAVTHDTPHHRFVIELEGADAELVYERRGRRLILVHTEVPESLQGHGVGGELVMAALDWARNEDLTVAPWCPYARHWLREHPDDIGSTEIDWHVPPPT
jgi:hypothetical protein